MKEFTVRLSWRTLLPAIFIAVSVLLFFFLGSGLIDRTSTICAASNENKAILRTLLTAARNETIASKDITPAQRVRAIAFYDKYLPLTDPKNC